MRRQPTIVQYDLEELGEVNAGFKNNNNGHDTDDESVGGHGGGGGGGVRFDGSSNVVITGSGKVRAGIGFFFERIWRDKRRCFGGCFFAVSSTDKIANE